MNRIDYVKLLQDTNIRPSPNVDPNFVPIVSYEIALYIIILVEFQEFLRVLEVWWNCNVFSQTEFSEFYKYIYILQ